MSLTISFTEGTPAERNKRAQVLLQSLRECLPEEVVVKRERDDPNAQDAGTTLAIVLGVTISRMVIEVSGKAIAEVLKDYIEKWYTQFKLSSSNQELVIDHDMSSSELANTIRSALDPSADSTSV